MRGWGRGQLAACVAGATAAWAIAAPATGRQEAPAREGPAPQVSVVASVDRSLVTTVEGVTLTVRVLARGIEIDSLVPQPVAGEALGDFIVAWVRREPPGAEGGAVVHRWSAGLEPFLPGEAIIPAIGVQATGAEGPIAGVASAPIEVRVSSVLEGAAAFEPARLRPPLDPIPPGAKARGWWMWIAAACVAALGLAATGALLRRPTPERRVRTAFAPIRRRAAEVAGLHDGDVGERAMGVVAVVRDAATVLMGDRARALTSRELTAELGARAPSIPTDQLDRLKRLMEWEDGRVYGGSDAPPPEAPDAVGIAGGIEAEAIAAVRGRRAAAAGGPAA